MLETEETRLSNRVVQDQVLEEVGVLVCKSQRVR
jgi:hypothetical protein